MKETALQFFLKKESFIMIHKYDETQILDRYDAAIY